MLCIVKRKAVFFFVSKYELFLPNKEEFLKIISLKRMGTADDVAAAVKFLALEADYITGQVIEVDGGMLI
mgnify:CR=1 FL=1